MIRTLALSALLLAVACGGDNLVLPAEGSPTTITIIAGDEQSGRVGATLADPIVAGVTDARDRPVVGVAVVFTFDGGPGATVVPDTAITDADGHASVQLQLGTEVGAGQGVARVIGGVDAVLQAGFTAVAMPASASGIRELSGDDQVGQVGSTLAERLVVEVTDAFGNPKGDATISWTVSDGGRVSATTTTTGADGRTSVQRTLGPNAGIQTTRASAPGLAGSPVIFRHTAMAAAASRVTIVSGNSQTGAVAMRVPQDPVVQVSDASGNPVAGATVSWIVTAGGGSADPATSTTGGNGRTSTRWVLGSAPGANQLEARVAAASTATFTATATAGASASLVVRTPPSATAVVGVPFDQQPVVQLRDAAGNDVKRSGVAVLAAVVTGDGSLAGATTRTTDGNGQAHFTDLRVTGAVGPHTLLFAANGHTSVTSTSIEVRKAPTTTTITSVSSNPSAPGQPVTVVFSVTSGGGTPSGAVTVSASGGSESCSAAVSAGSCVVSLSVEGHRTLTASYGGDALFEGSSDTELHDVVHTNTAPSASGDTYTTVEDDEQALVVPAPGVLANDTDPDGDPLQAQGASAPSHGTVTLNQDGSFSYHPEPDYWGDDSFTYQVSDGANLSNTATVTLTVVPVNDAPSLQILGGDQTVTPGAGPQQVPGFASVESLGAPNEGGQTGEFLVEVDPAGAGLFAQAPAITPDGTLTYAPSGAEGAALVTVRLRDNGGTDNGGADTSGPQTFTITVTGGG